MGKYSSLIVVGLMVAVMFVRLQTHNSLGRTTSNAVEKYERMVLRNIANSGAYAALNALTLNVYETDGQSNVPLYGGHYSYSYERQEQDATLGPTQVRVTVTAEYNSQHDTVVVLLTRPSFSRFAYFSNIEGNIWFHTGDSLRGPVHTNEYFRMSGYPVFFDKVTSHELYSESQPYRRYPWGPTDPQFLGGTEWGVPELFMPENIPQELIDAAQDSGIYINNRHAWLIFQADGTVRIASKNTSGAPSPSQYTTYTLANTNGVIYVHYSSARPMVRVKGTVNGRVTVGTRGSIRITNNLLLADNPLTNPNSDDMIGLVAAKDIIVANNHRDQDRTIQATIMTMNHSTDYNDNFWVKNYDLDRYGTLHLLGGLIQYARGAVGLVGDEYSRKGYLKDYRWDQRLKTMSPPHFPMLFVLRKISWWD